MRFMYMALHFPTPEHSEDLLRAMRTLAEVMGTLQGLEQASAWREKGSGRIVATSIWNSEDAFLQALPSIGATVKGVPFEEWEARPRELFRLEEIG